MATRSDKLLVLTQTDKVGGEGMHQQCGVPSGSLPRPYSSSSTGSTSAID